jgi:hypothetical protein
MSPGHAASHLGTTGLVFFMNGCDPLVRSLPDFAHDKLVDALKKADEGAAKAIIGTASLFSRE